MGKSESRTEQYLAQIGRYESNPIVTSVLAQDTSFEREVEEFYNMATWLKAIPRVGVGREFKIWEENSQMRGRTPSDLVEILGGFSEEPFDSQKLQYDSVREDYKRWNAPSRNVKRLAISIPTFLGAIAGGVGAFIFGMNGDTYEAIALSVGAAGSFGAHFWSFMYFPRPNGTNDELGEYIKLHEAAERADGFMKHHYRNHFIKKALSHS